jgi:photosystem II stability/assembly factor-like uncharacterized protein
MIITGSGIGTDIQCAVGAGGGCYCTHDAGAYRYRCARTPNSSANLTITYFTNAG